MTTQNSIQMLRKVLLRGRVKEDVKEDLNAFLPNCSVLKDYVNFQIFHLAIKPFQNIIVKWAEIIPETGIFFELPTVRCGRTTKLID